MVSGTEITPFSSLECFMNQPHQLLLFMRSHPAAHLRTPSPHTPHAPPHLASLSSGLGATETVTRNLNPGPPHCRAREPPRDGQPETFGQGSSPGHVLRAGWPAWHSPLPRAKAAGPSHRPQPAAVQRLGHFVADFCGDPPPSDGVSWSPCPPFQSGLLGACSWK